MAHQQNAVDTLTSRFSDTRDPVRRGSSTASHKDTPSRARSKRISQLSGQGTLLASSSSSSSGSLRQNGGAGPSTAAFPSITTPAPLSSQRIPRTPRTASEPMLRSVSEKSYDPSVLETPLNNKGKRKAEDVDLTPPDQRTGHHTTFVIPTDGRSESFSLSSCGHIRRVHPPAPAGTHHVSEVSKPPSSYHGRKRARLSTSGPSPSASPAHSTLPHLTDSWPVGFILLSLWWFVSFWCIPPIRVVGGTDTENAVAQHDPQVEHGECFKCHVFLRCVVARLRQAPFPLPLCARSEILAILVRDHVGRLALHLG